jgi:predicted lipid-binding transport protein (Tim44 family)
MAAETALEPPPAVEELAAEPVAAPPPKTPKKPPAPKGGKDKGGRGSKKDEEAEGDGPNIAAHPRAARAVARAKSWGGLAGFLFGGYVSLPTNTLAGAGLRALVAGVVCYVAVWAGAVFLWRRLVILEIKGREQQLIAAANAGVQRELPPGRPAKPSARSAS